MSVGVIGGGTMGVGIAHRFAAHGYDVHLVDVDLATAKGAVDRVAATLHTAVDRAKLTVTEGEAAISRLVAHGSIDDMPEGLELIIEAVIEDAELKGTILGAAQLRNPTTLASNTSSISIDQLAASLGDPASFAGMHFFNPVWAMHLVEVVRGSATSDDTIGRIVATVQRLGMEHAVINDAPGFATSRLGVLVGLEAIRMVEAGVASPVDIDTAMRLGYGHPMGPLMLGDLVGLDVRLGIAEHLASVYGSRFEPPDLLRTMVATGRLGKKAGLGFYDWSSGSAEPVEEP
ncbi:MAG TPA: 3-hydroxyacyl-CoA dehydrogenase family protein [Acidimicrobiia bacterium]|nr:3-hydroxyacyl-CoA dehydrogenase family protein [Acidimicrobiia bacterium]